MKLTSPSQVFGTAEAADEMNLSPRQVQRLLKEGKLQGSRPNGRWVTSAVAIWRYQGIEADMRDYWTDSCAKAIRGSDNY